MSPRLASLMRRLAAEAALLTAGGVIMGFLGPFGSSERTLYERQVYWLILIIGGGLIGVAIDEAIKGRLPGFWPRLMASSLGMTPGVTALVILVNWWMVGGTMPIREVPQLAFQVWIVSFVIMALRQLALTRPPPPAPAEPQADPTEAFRKRLSARRRTARLIAVEAEDHYLRVHTDAGDELITARFADALAELAAAPGFQTHRSWWIAADAIEAASFRRGSGEVRLAGGLTAPLSRSHAPRLREAGWLSSRAARW